MAGWDARYELSDHASKELYLRPSSERSDRDLFLLPINWNPEGCWGIWKHQSLQSSSNSSAFPSTCWRSCCTCWGLVQEKSEGKPVFSHLYQVRNLMVCVTNDVLICIYFLVAANEIFLGWWSQSSRPRWPHYQWPWLEWIHIHCRTR